MDAPMRVNRPSRAALRLAARLVPAPLLAARPVPALLLALLAVVQLLGRSV